MCVFVYLSIFFFLVNHTAYVDVCDDTNHAFRAKSFNDKAEAANIPAIIYGGIYPGVSNGLSLPLLFRRIHFPWT